MMDFLQTLRAHRGGLLRIKSELFWYGGRGWDGARGRICLLLDADPARSRFADAEARRPEADHHARAAPAAALLLIDGCPQWVWVGQEGVELIT